MNSKKCSMCDIEKHFNKKNVQNVKIVMENED